MNARPEILTGNEISTGRRKPSALVAEYEAKVAAIPEAVAAYEAANKEILRASTIAGTFPGMTLDTGRIGERDVAASLLKSAWRHCWALYDLANYASAEKKKRVGHMFEAPPPFTVESIRDQFGDLVADPWGSILKGLAEVFADLDPAYKSHEKVKIGVKGLPKRVVLGGFNSSYSGWGMDKVRDIINALAAFQGKPLVSHLEMSLLERDGEALNDGGEALDPFESHHAHRRRAEAGDPPKVVKVIGRGVWLKKFKNGNGHLFFSPEALLDINRAMAEFYGDVLADCSDDDGERPARRASTDVAKDLQYYPTPPAVIDRLMADLEYRLKGARVLEPSCGCGRIMDRIRSAGAAEVIGIEVDLGRADEARSRGHAVFRANFLDMAPPDREADLFAVVVMNPPFYGKHYAKHVRHAMKFLKPGGILVSILPATARYDHGLLDDLKPSWRDLPVGAFAESGTNICTTIATIHQRSGL
jgi:SAM-dependent methyltransferase